MGYSKENDGKKVQKKQGGKALHRRKRKNSRHGKKPALKKADGSRLHPGAGLKERPPKNKQRHRRKQGYSDLKRTEKAKKAKCGFHETKVKIPVRFPNFKVILEST